MDYEQIPPLFSTATAPTSIIGAPSSGIGMAPRVSAETPKDVALSELQGLPTSQKIGLALQSFGAGVAGRPDPIASLIDENRRDRLLKANELRANIGLLHEAVKNASSLEGDARKSYLDQMAPQLEELRPGMGEALKKFKDQPDAIAKYEHVLPFMDTNMQNMARANPAGFVKWMGTEAGWKAYQDGYDKLQLRVARAKGQHALLNQDLIPPEIADKIKKQGYATASDFKAIQAAMPEDSPAKITDRQWEAISNKSDQFHQDLGILSPKAEEEIRKKKIEQGPQSAVGKIQSDLDAGLITPAEAAAAKTHAVTFAKQVAPVVINRAGIVPPEHADLHGQDYIATLPAGIANTVKKIASYDVPLTTLSTRTGEREAMLERVSQFDPTFSVPKYSVRMGVMQDFTKGKTADNLTALDQALNHMGTLDSLAMALKNNDIQAVNKIKNAIRVQLGDSSVTNYQTAQSAVGTELMRVFRQVNASESETKDWISKFPVNGSPEQIHNALMTGAKLLGGRVNALNRRWNNGMDVETGYPKMMSAEAQSVLDRLGGNREGATVKSQERQRRATDTAPQTNAKGWQLMTDAKGNKAYVGPNNEIEEVK